ncbi:MAG: DUF4157 domain-containing protein [Bacteroidota bacterium]
MMKQPPQKHGTPPKTSAILPIQPKLSINQPGDPYEQEADAMADQVMRMEQQASIHPSPLPIQRMCAECEEEHTLQKTPMDIQREDDQTSVSAPEPESTPVPQAQSSRLGVDWFEMTRPFHTRGVSYLLYTDTYHRTVSSLWSNNFRMFSLMGVGSEAASSAANFFTPFAIDAALSTDYPTQWEIMDRRAGVSTISASPTLLTFDLSNLGRTLQFAPLKLFGDQPNPYTQRKEQSGTGFSLAQHSPDFGAKLNRRKGHGQALNPETQSQMGVAFGQDFRDVRIHNDHEAAGMSQQIHAKAFTHGADIYFNHGQYQPESSHGKHLLAHELTHVVQQGGTPQAIQRSTGGAVAGGIIGGLVGGGIGAGLGSLLGVGGAIGFGILGAAVGGLLGTILGDIASADERPLDTEEQAAARLVFGNSLNIGVIRIATNAPVMSSGQEARAPGNTIYASDGLMQRRVNDSQTYMAIIIHELTHSWQMQHGLPLLTLIGGALRGEYLEDMRNAYNDYDNVETKLRAATRAGKCFNDFNPEEQGDLTMYYYLSKKEGRDLSPYQPFIDQVRNHGVCNGEPYYSPPEYPSVLM